MAEIDNVDSFLFYTSTDNRVRLEVVIGDDNVWLNLQQIAALFNRDKSVISRHLSNIFEEGELDKNSTVAKNATVQNEGGRKVSREIEHFNLDVIISVGYRVNSYEATQFRKWATKILKEYLIKGFAMDDERLKQGKNLLGKDYFGELLERIREIRASERRFYQKITDIYATSLDYDSKSPITQEFYSTVQNKLHWAIHGHTAAELITKRVDAKKPHMGLTSWKGDKDGGKIHKIDVSVAKNYLTKDEIEGLNRIVAMYLDYAENQAARNKPMKMADWTKKLDAFLEFNEYDILPNLGKVSKKVAKTTAEKEYKKFRVRQDKEFKSDFDDVIGEIADSGKLPSEVWDEMVNKNPALSEFNKSLNTALNYNPKEKQ